ncbi:MAG: hypothetical protein OEQ18_13510 [Gammaproteobacteria bacterium]|nr:hypothetical protein [Gammaproteobacteria bacterium]
MNNGHRSRIVAVLSVLALTAASHAQEPYSPPRLVGTQLPDFNGIWQALNTAHWDIRPHAAQPSAIPDRLGALHAVPAGPGVVVGGEIPYQPWAAERQRENFAGRLTRPIDRATNETTGDGEAKCYMPGVPRATYMPFPFQIIQTPEQILIVYEYANATRIVHMASEPPSPAPSWMGWSIGRFEGDTLVIEVTDQNDQTWFDRAGNFHSEELVVTERYTQTGPNHLRYEASIEDPAVFTRPWTISMPLYRRVEENVQLMEFKCVEFAEQFMYEHILEPSGETR